MSKQLLSFLTCGVLLLGLSSCTETQLNDDDNGSPAELLKKYTPFTLTSDMSLLTDNQRRMIPILIDAAKSMDDIYWVQAYGDKEALMDGVTDADLREYIEINYGPWDRLDGNRPFVSGVGEKPAGANFYPEDMTADEFNEAVTANPDLQNLYTMVRRDADGNLTATTTREYFADQMAYAADKLREAAEFADEPGLKRYLLARADAFGTGDYYTSDMAWMDMKDNSLDVVIGPIEVYEDELFGYKAAAEAYVLVKDKAWSARLARFAALLPMLQTELPVAPEYKTEMPGTDSDLNAYDAIYYAGQANAGSKTIAINLPNDERVQAAKGSRRLQLKNAMRAKFDKILVPIAGELIAEDQRGHVTFDAFFSNTMFHEVAHGLGPKNTLDGSGTVRAALRELGSALEEGKADILGLYMVTKLNEKGEYDTDLMDNYVTFMASIFRSVRFGASSAHGKANMVRFNYFQEKGAFSKDADGYYRVEFDKMQDAMNSLSELILTLQGDGNYQGVADLVEKSGNVGAALQADLDKLGDAGIPVDIIFDQGLEYLDL